MSSHGSCNWVKVPASVFAVFIVILLALVPVVPTSGKIAIEAAMVIISALSWQKPSFRLGLFACIFGGVIFLHIPYSQLSFALVIALYLFVIGIFPKLRGGSEWFSWGGLGRDVAILCLATAAVSGVALVAWFTLAKPDITDLIQRFVPKASLPVLVLGGLVFAMVNAAVEEIVYRGAVVGGLAESNVPTPVLLPLQAIAFGTIHLGGFPSGWIGVTLATIYGFLLGGIRLRSRGLLAPWVGHLLTDLVIVVIVFSVSHRGS